MPKKSPVVPVSALDEKAMAEALNLSTSWLRHDRAGARRIPFYKIGKTVRYNPVRVAEALAELEEGGAAK